MLGQEEIMGFLSTEIFDFNRNMSVKDGDASITHS
jgi:hypothetical protein